MTFSNTPGADRVDLWVDPQETEPDIAHATHSDSATGDFRFDAFQIRNRNKNQPRYSVFDEIRIGTSYDAVLAIPPPAGTVLLLH
jgi:hypothetical protein